MNATEVVPNRFPSRLKGFAACLTLWIWIGLALPPVFGATTVVSDSFSDGNRSTQNLPNSAAWYRLAASGTTESVSSSTGYTITPASSGSSMILLSYFTSTTLTIGSTMTLSFTVTDTTNPGAASARQGLRFGLYNSGSTSTASTYLSADSTTLTSSNFVKYTGYAGFYSLQSALDTSGFSIGQRDGGTAGLTSSLFNSPTYTTLGSIGSSSGVSAATTYTVTLTLQYVSATEMDITASVNGNTLTRSSSTPITTFDTIGIFSSGYNGSITFDNVNVTVVPEPGVVVLLAVALAGGTLVLRGRKRKEALVRA